MFGPRKTLYLSCAGVNDQGVLANEYESGPPTGQLNVGSLR